MIDFHCHSNYSDGDDSVEQLFNQALENGIRQLALTDHDTVAGLERLHALCANTTIRCINGIELSTRWKKHDIHVVGLNIDPLHPDLQESILSQIQCRNTRAKAIAQSFEKLGLTHCWEKVTAIAGHTHVARPHFANLLISEGWTKTIQQGFTQYLARGKVAYIPTQWMHICDAVKVINAAGGVAVLAHPLKYKLTRTKLQELIFDFKNAGGQAIEVISGQMQPKDIRESLAMCEDNNLFASTGSDYHGLDRSRVRLGGQAKLPEKCKPVWTLWED